MAGVVLVTGVSRYLGGLLARRLAAEPSVTRVVGVDVIPPPQEIAGVEFVRADIRNPMIGRVIEDAGVDTVVHMNVIATPTFVG
ncbi:NAD-dependent epimerase/dehydratase family protein, partial [Phycicoccus flavus]